jgi:hypothetical protein
MRLLARRYANYAAGKMFSPSLRPLPRLRLNRTHQGHRFLVHVFGNPTVTLVSCLWKEA